MSNPFNEAARLLREVITLNTLILRHPDSTPEDKKRATSMIAARRALLARLISEARMRR